jgi:GDP-L-fucose synthase
MEKNSKAYIAGHRGMVGSVIVRCLKRQGYQNLVYYSSAEPDQRNSEAVLEFQEIQSSKIQF